MKAPTESLIKYLKYLSSNALVIHLLGNPTTRIIAEAADKLEELSQDEQEPAAWWSGEPDTYILPNAEYQRHKANENFDGIRRLKPLYTAKPKRNPLSDDEIRDCAESENLFYFENKEEFDAFARAIEAAHGITNEP